MRDQNDHVHIFFFMPLILAQESQNLHISGK